MGCVLNWKLKEITPEMDLSEKWRQPRFRISARTQKQLTEAIEMDELIKYFQLSLAYQMMPYLNNNKFQMLKELDYRINRN